jgi:DNA repair protein RadA/Sms
MVKAAGPARAIYRCAECGWQTAQWVGRCGECHAWGTIDGAAAAAGARTRVVAGPVSAPALRIHDVAVDAARARPTGVAELDRVLGGGLVPAGVVLLAGEPGVGKSTLLLEVAARFASPATPVLYVSGEESAGQVRLRAGRTGALDPHLYVAAETDLAAIVAHVDAVNPALLVVDSVQTIAAPGVEGTPGGVTQVREVAAALTRLGKERGISVVLVGHVTKDGSIAGPRLLEHLVDVVLHFEGDRHSTLRMVRAVKNRFGPADEVGCFELGDEGIRGLADPSGLFLSSRRQRPEPGTCVTVTLEGRRPLLAEVQALVVPASGPSPRRTNSGLDGNRVALLLAVLERVVGLRLPRDRGGCGTDVYTATVGGMRIGEPAADLAVSLAVASAVRNKAIAAGTVVLGEIGLAGEVRRVPGIDRRLAEAARLGFTYAIVPPDAGPAPDGMVVTEVGDVTAAVQRGLSSVRPVPPLRR